MQEISLNILDVAQNSITAGATLIIIDIKIDYCKDILTVIITDNGRGMDDEQVKNAVSPFYTTRTTRKIGMGLPLLKMGAEMADGGLKIESSVGFGTIITATYRISHIDRMPLGDLAGTFITLMQSDQKIDLILRYCSGDKSFFVDTREIKKLLDCEGKCMSKVFSHIGAYISEQIKDCNEGKPVL